MPLRGSVKEFKLSMLGWLLAEPPGAGGSGGRAHGCSGMPAPAAPPNSSPRSLRPPALPSHNIPNGVGLNRPTQRPRSQRGGGNTLRPPCHRGDMRGG